MLVFARLADSSARLPMPGQPGSFFPAEGRLVDEADPLWGYLLRDGSLVTAEPPASAAEPVPSTPADIGRKPRSAS